MNVPFSQKSYRHHNVVYKRKKCHLHDCFGIKYDNLNQEGKKLTETARQQIQSAVLSLSTRGPEAREIIGLRKEAEVDRALRRMLSSANPRVHPLLALP